MTDASRPVTHTVIVHDERRFQLFAGEWHVLEMQSIDGGTVIGRTEQVKRDFKKPRPSLGAGHDSQLKCRFELFLAPRIASENALC